MALEASIVERLQELRRWQVEQQERLLQHQQEQRETLSREQVRMYQALGLSVQDDADETRHDSVLHDSLAGENEKNKVSARLARDRGAHISPQMRHELLHDLSPASTPRSAIKNAENESLDGSSGTETASERLNLVFNNKENVGAGDFSTEPLLDGVEPLPLDKPTRKSLIIDDMPVPSPKKDFHTLLEERLRESEHAVGGEKSGGIEGRAKRPFLRKGQGLARFRLGGTASSSTNEIRPRSMSLPSTVRMENGKGAKTQAEKSSEPCKPAKKRTTRPDKVQKKQSAFPSRAQNRLSLKNVKPPVRVRSKSMCSPQESKTLPDDDLRQDRFNVSDIESKTKREMEEVRIFELLEEKAENSSFCSTSSTVVALLQQSVQSTPLKARGVGKSRVSSLAQNWINEQDDTSDDLLLAEIVYTTQSNGTVQNSSAMNKRRSQNDPANLRGGAKPLLDPDASRQTPNRQSFDQHSTDADICELPYGTDVDPDYGAELARIDHANYPNDTDFGQRINYEKNTSLHVRFSEYNEYKTIGLTDTSTISNDSEPRRRYSDQRAWSDCSVTTDSSDCEEQDRITSLESEGTRKRCETKRGKDADGNIHGNYYRDDRSEGEEGEDRSDFEAESESKGYDYHESAQDHDASEVNDKRENLEPENDASALADSTLIEEELSTAKAQDENGLVFKSELLKTRLLELEREIEIFRKENIAVTTLKEKLQEERRALERGFKEKESLLEERKQKLESAVQEEKKRLAREKSALENRLKDVHAKAQQSKQERQEIKSLKDQLEELREEMAQKESRWNAAQARHRSQVRILQSENSKLKQEMEKLQNGRKASARARLHGKHVTPSNTRAIHQINKQLESQKQQTPRKQDSSSDEEDFLTQPMMEALHPSQANDERENCDGVNTDGSRMIVYERSLGPKTRNDTARKRDLYENLLKDATMGLKENEEATKRAIQSMESRKGSVKCDEQLAAASGEANDAQNRSASEDDDLCELVIETNGDVSSKSYIPSNLTSSTSNSNGNAKVDKQGVREVKQPDGRTEFWYPNGNVKKVSADGSITKLIYYNGDVCESRGDGSVKYFYATTRTWHTTMADGLEILEFPDGQVERRSQDGTVEVSFPDGTVRILQSNGTEKWALPDGTLAETSADGEKVLILPNGQREVHTKEHKRREYPDGTVKLVYPDGSQETRYAGGRVRLKDKDGNLLMDSHHQ